MTFDLLQTIPGSVRSPATIEGSLNGYFEVEGFICLKDVGTMAPAEFVPEPIADAFRDGATCVVTNCPNAAGAMFRLVVDLTTRPLLPPEGGDAPGLTSKVRRDLGLRLPWLFDNGLLPRERTTTTAPTPAPSRGKTPWTSKISPSPLLERVFTERERLKLAEVKRAQRSSYAKGRDSRRVSRQSSHRVRSGGRHSSGHCPPGAHRPGHGRCHSRMTSGRKLGVFCMQHGPGTENAYGGVAQAFGDSIPILVVPGGYPRPGWMSETHPNEQV